MKEIISVVLCGGSGDRLWPLSTTDYPKQFIKLNSNLSLFQETLHRLKKANLASNLIILCNVDYRFIVAEQCAELKIKKYSILLEPEKRNTAPAICAAAIHANKINPLSSLIIFPSDHAIGRLSLFKKAIQDSFKKSFDDMAICFGIKPVTPSSQYGYIKTKKITKNNFYQVETFVEKPNSTLAKSYFKKNNYFWNCGIFSFKTNFIINEFKKYLPSVFKYVSDSYENSIKDLDFIRLDKKSFFKSPSISIDYGYLEKSKKIGMIYIGSPWSDLGSWSSLYNYLKKDKKNNVLIGDINTSEVKNSFLVTTKINITAVGLSNISVIASSNAVLIFDNKNIQKVDNYLKQNIPKYPKHLKFNNKSYQPWGWFEVIDEGDFFKVKRLHLNPHARLSLQMHHNRAEHWTIINGTATVFLDDEKYILEKGKSIDIPIKSKHSLFNNTKVPLEIIEVQSGKYLGEDDIVRFEDIYGRAK